MHRPRLAKLIALTAGAAMLTASGHAQNGPPDLTRNPFLMFSNPTQWETRREIHISPPTFTHRNPGGSRQSITDRIILSEMTIVSPLNHGCATATTDTKRLTEAVLKVDHRVIVDKHEVVPGFSNGEELARWDANGLDTRRLTISLRGPATTYEVKPNEELALQIPWPEDGYPEEIATSLEPQQFIESDDPAVVRLMKRWTNNNPQGPNPYLVAKALAGMVVENFQPSESDFRYDDNIRFAGIQVSGAESAARSKRGSEADMAALLCAVYRAAGLPARVVIGLDVAGSPGGRANVPAPSGVCRSNFIPENISHPLIRTWVEFYLYDEANNRGGWIPVDIKMIRLTSSRMQSLERVWDGFGGGMCFQHLIPVSFHFTPPMTAGENQPASLWGWLTSPDCPDTDQELILEAVPKTQRGGRR